MSIPVIYVCGMVLAAASASYLLLALWRVMRFLPRANRPSAPMGGVTILKPLCGLEPRLYDCLRSFCVIDHAPLQIVFGVADPFDPALEVVARLKAEFPAFDLVSVTDRTVHGTNLKVSNLINMYGAARYDIVVVSDSDTTVTPDCLEALLALLADRATGAVTCLYKAAPAPGLASMLGALFVNDWFLASATVDAGMRDIAYCFGPVTALRREALDAMGGFHALSSHLADDFMLGRLVAKAGYKVRLASCVPDISVVETFPSLLAHELRWARTVRTVKPGEHFMSGVMELLPLIAVLLLPYPALGGWWVLAALMLLRVALHYAVRWRFAIAVPARPWLLPLRECLCFAIWLASFRSYNVRWRDRSFVIASGGQLVPRPIPSASASGGL